MQDFSRELIFPGVTLTHIGTDKFKTGYLSVNLMAPLRKDTASKNAVLPRVLRRGTASCPDMKSISEKLDDLYGAAIEPSVRKRGECQIFGFVSSFIDDKYAPGTGIFEKLTSLMAEMLIYPHTFHGRLSEEYVKGERENLINEIRSEINYKQAYCTRRMLENMFKDEPYSLSSLGTESEAEKISVATLTKHYREVIQTSPIEIFYSGSAEYKDVKMAVMSSFSALPRAESFSEIFTAGSKKKEQGEIKIIEEKMSDITQGKLSIGIRLGDNYRKQSLAVLSVFDAVFGGAVTSKLFTNVREKLSLCYYASSSYDFSKGVMIVGSGIDSKNFQVAKDEILLQFEKTKAGDITAAELENAKRKIKNDLMRVSDGQSSSEIYYIDRFSNGIFFSPEEMVMFVENVTVGDIVKLGESAFVDTVYFLSGKGDGDEK